MRMIQKALSTFSNYNKGIALGLLIVVLLLFVGSFQIKVDQKKEAKEYQYNNKPITSELLSPSWNQSVFIHYPENNTSEKAAIIVHNREKDSFQEIYSTNHASWDIRSDLYWLTEDYIFFLRHCGTSCQGLTLLHPKSTTISQAVVSYSTTSDQPQLVHFQDWFGSSFEFPGLVSAIYADYENGRHYLVFNMANDKDVEIDEKRFLFTGDNLIEVDH